MNSFSQRLGLKPIRTVIQREAADEPLRNALWNCLTMCYWQYSHDNISSLPGGLKRLYHRIWVDHYKERFDEIPPYAPNLIIKVKKDFLTLEWNEMFDILDFVPNNYEEPNLRDGHLNETNQKFISSANNFLEQHLSAYRFVNMHLTEITSEEEISSIEEAVAGNLTGGAVQTHLKRALELFADRKNPDYRNSIKESISAIEAYAAILTNDPKATLGQALKEIEKTHELHPALKKAFSNLYGYTSDESGIRHFLLEESTLKQEDAKFMLVACSAFVNYLSVKAAVDTP